jgi:hypothetical protein
MYNSTQLGGRQKHKKIEISNTHISAGELQKISYTDSKKKFFIGERKIV